LTIRASYVLDVKRPLELLRTLLAALADEETVLVLDGHLNRVDFGRLHGVTVTTYPGAGDYRKAEIILTADNVDALVRSVLPRVGVVHETLITKAGETLFYAYDYFDPGWYELGKVGSYNNGAMVTLDDGEGMLDELIERGIIRRYVPKQSAGQAGQ
jgi:hypothetical protein